MQRDGRDPVEELAGVNGQELVRDLACRDGQELVEELARVTAESWWKSPPGDVQEPIEELDVEELARGGGRALVQELVQQDSGALIRELVLELVQEHVREPAKKSLRRGS